MHPYHDARKKKWSSTTSRVFFLTKLLRQYIIGSYKIKYQWIEKVYCFIITRHKLFPLHHLLHRQGCLNRTHVRTDGQDRAYIHMHIQIACPRLSYIHTYFRAGCLLLFFNSSRPWRTRCCWFRSRWLGFQA